MAVSNRVAVISNSKKGFIKRCTFERNFVIQKGLRKLSEVNGSIVQDVDTYQRIVLGIALFLCTRDSLSVLRKLLKQLVVNI